MGRSSKANKIIPSRQNFLVVKEFKQASEVSSTFLEVIKQENFQEEIPTLEYLKGRETGSEQRFFTLRVGKIHLRSFPEYRGPELTLEDYNLVKSGKG